MNLLCAKFINVTDSFFMHAISRLHILTFIKDFRLKKPDGIISFDAVIEFEIDNRKKMRESEVQVITSGNLEAVYLMNEKITDENLPDMFSSGKESFEYIINKCLEINGEIEGKKFIVSIFPKSVQLWSSL